MNEQELIEKLAKRLYMAWMGMTGDIGDKCASVALKGQGDMSRPDYTRMAKECLRQMKWAQEQGIQWCENEEGYAWGRPEKPLTPAPDDWKYESWK